MAIPTLSVQIFTSDDHPDRVDHIAFGFSSCGFYSMFSLYEVNEFWKKVEQHQDSHKLYKQGVTNWRDLSNIVCRKDKPDVSLFFKETSGGREDGIIVKGDTVTFTHESKRLSSGFTVPRNMCYEAFRSLSKEVLRIQNGKWTHDGDEEDIIGFE